MKNSITKEEIQELLDNSERMTFTVFEKCTITALKLPNGFILVESSACVDPSNYNESLGEKLNLERVEKKLWELEGYSLQKELNKL